MWKRLNKNSYIQVLFVFAAFALMVTIGGLSVSNTLQESSLAAVNVAMDETEKTIRAYLREPKIAFYIIYAAICDILDEGESQEAVTRYLTRTMDLLGGLEDGIRGFINLYGYIREEMMYGMPFDADIEIIPQQRPWYQTAVRNREAEYTAPYIDLGTNLPIISLAKEIYGYGGEYYGVLALDVDISWLMGYAESLQFVEGGYGMIVSQYLQVIAHPNERYQGLRLREMGPGYYGVADMLQHNRSVANERIQDSDGSSAIVFFKQLYNDWYVGVVMPLGSYLADLYLNIALLAALGLVLSLILSFILLRLSADKIRSEEESRSKSSFLAMMSHEMRTPMNAIIGMTTIAKRSGDAGRKDYALDKIEDASSHLLGVINNILDMSKIEAGKLDMHPVDFDFAGLMDSVTGIVNFKVNEKGLRLTLDLDEHIPARVRCDDQRLAQILTNLLSNAVKFTPDGGSVALTARLLSMDGKECLLWFEVADDGIGIGKEQQARLFTPFVQAERSTASKYGGTGLGLYLTKRIVELMGGSITLTSAPGKGTAFTFTVAAEAAGDAEGVGAKAAGAGDSPADGSQPDEGDHGHYEFPGRRILLAEDLDINREIVLSLLESTMVSIDCASDGKEAVRMYRESESGYDMVFMDVQMPVMDGFEATRAIRALDSKGSKDVPIIAMTANVFKEDVENCLNAGMDAHVGKPIDYDALLQVMERYLGDPGTPDAGG